MKKLIAVLLIIAMVCSMFCVTAFATNGVVSPEKDNTDVDVQPSSPQTGGMNIGWIIAAAVVLCAAAVMTVTKIKKVRA